MTCAEFELGLTECLAGEIDEARKAARLAELSRHARSCEDCADALDLLEWGSLPSEERDPIDDPGEAYWATFDERLHRRIASAGESRSRAWVAWATAASVGLVAVAGWWWVARDGSADASLAGGQLRFDLIELEPFEPEPLALPPELEDLVARASQGASDAASLAVGLEAWPEDARGLPEGLDSVLASLSPESASVLLEAFDGGEESTETDASGLARGDWRRSLFPETSDLDAGARDELLQWLESRTGA